MFSSKDRRLESSPASVTAPPVREPSGDDEWHPPKPAGQVGERVGMIVVGVNDRAATEFAEHRQRHPWIDAGTPANGVHPDPGGLESIGEERAASGDDDTLDVVLPSQFARQQVDLSLSPAPFATAGDMNDAQASGGGRRLSAGQRSPWR